MKNIRQHKALFSYRGKSVEYSFWSNVLEGQKPDVVVLLGAGQTGAIVRLVAERAGPGVVVVGGVPHWHATSDTEDIELFTKLYFENAYQEILATFGAISMHILAESQAAPAAIILAGKLKQVGNLALIRPLGFSVQAFGNTVKSRLKTFRKRIFRTFLQYPQSFLYDPRNFVASMVLMRAMLREESFASLSKKYAVGISYDSLQDLQLTAQALHKAGNTVNLILGQRDRMFPPEEVMAALKNIHIPHVEVTVLQSVSHSSLATRGSQKILARALGIVRK